MRTINIHAYPYIFVVSLLTNSFIAVGWECTAGHCDMDGCTESCSCTGGHCNMNDCTSNCFCTGGHCSMNSCSDMCLCTGGHCSLNMSNCTNCSCLGGHCSLHSRRYWGYFGLLAFIFLFLGMFFAYKWCRNRRQQPTGTASYQDGNQQNPNAAFPAKIEQEKQDQDIYIPITPAKATA
ncbi:predicted protein [Chaetoceros tenuissimus]|uniref:Uncharacterized protein n=1 Tax=Chaetoceros tenuissimus TaxID=426638 RepID=A0AAD3H0F1_9STRA|nr:predicted protein [Chaetoceros tenuissimus]